jgi:hypothetical protein
MSEQRLDIIDDILTEFCTNSYGGGVVGEANASYIQRRFPHLVVQQRVYRLGDTIALARGVTMDTEGMVELEEYLLAHKESEYSIMDDETYSEVLSEKQLACVVEYAYETIGWGNPDEQGFAVDIAWEAIAKYGSYFEEYESVVLIHESDESEQAMLEYCKRKANTYMAHYYSGAQHAPEYCSYCEDAKNL